MENATASVVSRTIDGKYPDIARVIPTVYLAQVTVSKQELQKAVRVSKLFATGNILRFKVNALLGIQLSANDSQKGNNASVVEADIVGPEVEIALNINYVDDALSTIPTDKVVVEFQSGQQPAVFIPNEDITFKHIVMPMMVR
jgi:DNA polymerase-3 subunit beta